MGEGHQGCQEGGAGGVGNCGFDHEMVIVELHGVSEPVIIFVIVEVAGEVSNRYYRWSLCVVFVLCCVAMAGDISHVAMFISILTAKSTRKQ